MRFRGMLAVVGITLVITGCTGGPLPSPTPTPSDSSAPATACPTGTTLQDGLCLSGDAVSEELAGILRSQFAADELSAVIAGVWRDGEPVLFGALGESMPGVPATPDMHHMLGNLTTPMLTTVVLQQAAAGTFSIDDTIDKWYPDLPDASTVTIRMLLHNTAGYAQFTGLDDFLADLYANPFRVWEIDEIIDIGTEGGPLWEPGTDWGFSDTNSAVLVGILAKATGVPVSELIEAGVLEPLAMDDSTAALDGNWPQPVLQGYDGERGVWENVTHWNPSWAHFAGGVGSNAEDVGTFLDALRTGELLSDADHELQFAPETVGIGSNTPDQYWAMGFLVVRGWVFMNPNIPGYTGGGGTSLDEGWTVVVYATASQKTDPTASSASDIFRLFTTVLTPEHSLEG